MQVGVPVFPRRLPRAWPHLESADSTSFALAVRGVGRLEQDAFPGAADGQWGADPLATGAVAWRLGLVLGARGAVLRLSADLVRGRGAVAEQRLAGVEVASGVLLALRELVIGGVLV